MLPSIRYGDERLTITETAARLLPRLLHRLPEALWDTDETAETVQRDLCRAFASELALFLEQMTVARQMTLLLEAEGVDLTRLLEDYGLHRYLNRPDAYARQVGMACVWRVKGTIAALSRLTDLLFDLPHTVMATGASEVHVLVADTQPITTPYSYWTLTSREGVRYAVTVKNGFGWIATRPPPGLDVTPSGHQLAGFQVAGDDSNLWYVTVQGDTLHCSLTPPSWGPSDGTGYQTLDGTGQLWTFDVLSGPAVLRPVLLSSGNTPLGVLDPTHPFQTVQVRDENGTPWWLWVAFDIAHIHTAAPVGATDVTPSGGPYRWLRLYGAAGSLWYGFPSASGIWHVLQTTPGGTGTNAIQILGDDSGTNWRLGVTPGGTFGVSNTPRVHYANLATALMLRDRDGKAWYWRMHVPGPIFQVSDVLWPDTVSVMPWGSIGWLQVRTTEDTVLYVYPTVNIGVPRMELGPAVESPWGWSAPIPLRDTTGQLWDLVAHNDVLSYQAHAASDLPHDETWLSLREAYEAYRHVQAAGTQLTLLLS